MNRLVYLAAVPIAAVAFGLSSPATADPPEQGDGNDPAERHFAEGHHSLVVLAHPPQAQVAVWIGGSLA
jgi:hypothetical protein